MHKFWKNFYSTIIVAIFIGLICYGLACLALKFGWTNVTGSVDPNNQNYQAIETVETEPIPIDTTSPKPQKDGLTLKNICKIKTISETHPNDALAMQNAFSASTSNKLIAKMIFVFNLKNNDENLKNELTKCDTAKGQLSKMIAGAENKSQNNPSVFAWTQTDEWPIIVEALTKEKETINRAANAAQIEPRILVVPIVVEQLRLYFTQREYFQKFFKPFKILGVTTQMAMGVMSIKEKTATQIENNLLDKNSPFYPGLEFENLLDFKTDNFANERYNRLTNSKDQYYSYLYGALFIKEIETQWQKAGFPINDRPEILATVYNLGFEHSEPKTNPKIGGSTLNINGVEYTFGGLGAEFYYSGQMQDIFPFKP